MQRVCPKCNTLVTGDGAFCPSCGEPLPAAVQLDKEPAVNGASMQFSSNQYGAAPGGTQSIPQVNSVPNYGNNTQFTNANIVNTTEMTMGQWVGTIILTTWFSIISLILCIVWGVSDSTPIAKKRYCQAMIIIQAIGIVLSIIFTIIFTVVFAGIMPEIIEELENSAQYGYGGYYYG